MERTSEATELACLTGVGRKRKEEVKNIMKPLHELPSRTPIIGRFFRTMISGETTNNKENGIDSGKNISPMDRETRKALKAWTKRH